MGISNTLIYRNYLTKTFSVTYKRGRTIKYQPPHTHNGVEIYLSLSDLASVLLHSEMRTIHKNSLIVFPAYSVHQITGQSDIYERYILTIDIQWLSAALGSRATHCAYLQDPTHPLIFSLSEQELNKLKNLLERFLSAESDQQPALSNEVTGDFSCSASASPARIPENIQLKREQQEDEDPFLPLSLLFNVLSQIDTLYKCQCVQQNREVEYLPTYTFGKDPTAVSDTAASNTDLRPPYSTTKSGLAASASGKNVNRVIQYINSHLHEELSVSLLAERFFLNPDYLSRIFKQHVMITVGTYIQLQRIALARRLLAEGRSIPELPDICGFSSYAYFSRIFRKITGITPKQFQQQVTK